MQQRRFRLGDILDDYCPRERRLTNHAIVAMVDEEVKQTRCTTCDAEHEYKQGKMPTLRRKKAVSAAYNEVLAAVTGDATLAASVPQPPAAATPPPVLAAPPPAVEAPPRVAEASPQPVATLPPVHQVLASSPDAQPSQAASAAEAVQPDPPAAAADGQEPDAAGREEGHAAETGDGRVHRRLIRATLPRPENHTVERPIPEFTMRQANDRGGRFRGGMMRAAGVRPGGGGRGGGHPAGGGRGQAFGRPSGNRTGAHGSRPPGRHDANRPHRGGQSGKHGKKHSK